MQFDSFLFLTFFVVVLAVYSMLPGWRLQKTLLLLASYLFYAAWSPPLVALIWISTLVDYFAARRLDVVKGRTARRAWLFLSLAANLGLLGYFKYAEFLLRWLADTLGVLGVEYRAPALDIILPIGISFYTFQTLSYTIDVYQRRLPATRDLLDFALYVTFFPQLVAGPIVRAGHFLPQCRKPRRATPEQFAWGLSLLIFGLFAKVALADALLAPAVDQVYAAPESYAWVDAGVAALAFSGQIFFDFAGYSLCAIGAALCFGFVLPDNFLSPYASLGFSEFWQRWHVSLSSWLRDYLYIPLGGSRGGAGRTSVNLGLTMFLGGLWHGAAWTFVVWGWLHGLLLVVEHGLRRSFRSWTAPPLARAGLILLTFVIITLTWIPFRAQGFENMHAMLRALVRPQGELKLDSDTRIWIVVVTLATLSWHSFTRHSSLEERFGAFPTAVRGALIAVLLVAIALLSKGDSRAFIYFQF